MVNAGSERKHSEGLSCHPRVVSSDIRGELISQRLYPVVSKYMCTVPEHDIRRSLCELHVLGLRDYPVELCVVSGRRIHVVVLVYGGHHLAARIKRSLAHAREQIHKMCLRQILHRGVRYQSRLRRFANYLFSAVLVHLELSVTAKRHACCKYVPVMTGIINYGHFVLSESARLV